VYANVRMKVSNKHTKVRVKVQQCWWVHKGDGKAQ